MIKTINDLENCADERNIQQIEILRTELYEIRNYKMKGHMIRSKAQCIDQGEKPTKYFCGLEKHNFVSKIISKIIKDDETVITEQSKILKETELYYKQEFRGRRHRTCWRKSHRSTIRMWLLNKFISFLAVLTWKTGLKKM